MENVLYEKIVLQLYDNAIEGASVVMDTYQLQMTLTCELENHVVLMPDGADAVCGRNALVALRI